MTAASTPGSVSSTPPTAVGPPKCTAAALSVSVTNYGGGAGNAYETIVLRNHSAAVCWMRGFAGIGLVDGAGKAWPVTVERTTTYGMMHAAIPVTTVTVAPAGVASFWVEWANSGVESSGTIRITPPDDTQQVSARNDYVTEDVGHVRESPVTAGVVPVKTTSS